MTIKDLTSSDIVETSVKITKSKVNVDLPSVSSIKHQKKNGKIIFMKISSSSVVFDGKNARQVSALDITSKLKIKKKLEISEQLSKALVQNGSDLIAIIDRLGNYLYVSPKSLSILGIKGDRFNRRNAFEYVHEQDKSFVISQFKNLKKTKQVHIAPFRLMINNKQFRWVEAIVTDMIDNPAVAGIVVNAKDVTQNIKIEVDKDESIKRYNTLSKATSDAIYDWSVLSDEVIWNQGIKTIFGYKAANECKREWWMKCVHPDDVVRVNKSLQVHINNKTPEFMIKYRFRCSDGTYKFILDRGFIEYNYHGQPVSIIGALQDISDCVNYIQTIEKQNEKFREIAWEQSHLVRAPLANILGLTDLLIDNKTNYSELEEHLSHLKTAAEELDRAIRDIIEKIS